MCIQLLCLLLDHLDDFRMAVSGRTDGDAGVAIEKNVAVDVFNPDAAAAFILVLKTVASKRVTNFLHPLRRFALPLGPGSAVLISGRLVGAVRW